MDERARRIAALANVAGYDAAATKEYVDGAPHVKHASLRRLYGDLVVRVYDEARRHADTPVVLDLGAGEGSATIPFLELGAKVVAVDTSRSQLEALETRCHKFSDALEVRCQDAADALLEKGERYDIVVANSFLHHVPDYLGLITDVASVLKQHGQFFSFQDPLRYDSVGKLDRVLTLVAFGSWRVFKGDAVGALKREIRRARGVYLEDSVHDNAEYHVKRNGVDQLAIGRLLKESGFDCSIESYWSTQSRAFQPLGSALGLKNTFAVVARKRV